MFRLSQAILLALAATLSLAAAQSLPSCQSECRKLRGKCNVSLLQLSRTACLDENTNQKRTCDCGITTLQQLANLPKGSVLRDCVIPRPLFNFNSAITVNADLVNVHALRISNVGALRQNGDINRSTICQWKCVGSNAFQNCVIAGSVSRSTFDTLSAGQQATLSIGGPTFVQSDVRFMRTDGNMQIGCKDGFDFNKIDTLATPGFGTFSTVAGTEIRNNRFTTMALGKVSSFANVDRNTAGVASAEGPCNVINVDSPIEVENFLAIPDGPCQKLFKKV